MHQGCQGSTHTGELDAAVTALGSSTLLLQVKVTELTAGGLDDANLVGPRVVPIERKEKPSMNRSRSGKNPIITAIPMPS